MNRKILGLLIVTTLVWFAMHFAFLLGKVAEPWQALLDALTFAVCTLSILWIMALSIGYYRPTWQKTGIVLVITSLSALLNIAMYHFLHPLVLTGVAPVTAFISNGETLIFFIVFFLMLSFLLLSGMILEDEDREARIRQQSEVEKLARDAELNGLRLQLQPHFLFNSLNSIYALLQDNPQQAGKMVLLLSDFFRSVVNKSENVLIPFDEELRVVRMYLEIESIRFEHRLKIDYILEEGVSDKLLPALLLQPIIENAVKHGIYGTDKEVRIALKAQLESSFLAIEISNTCSPESPAGKGSGFGLDSVRRRLSLLYFRNDLMEVQSQNDTYIVKLKIPLE